MKHQPTGPAFSRSSFHPIADYAFLSDCETTALVAPDGNIEWLCLPRMDSPSVFGAILDRDAGHFRLGPTGVKVPAGPALPARHDGAGDELGHARRLDHRPRRAADGPVAPQPGPLAHAQAHADRLRRRPRAAAHRPVRQRRGPAQPRRASRCSTTGSSARAGSTPADGYNVAVARAPGSEVELRLTTDLNLGIEGARVTARHMMKEGETLFCALSWSEHPAPTTYEEAYDRLVWTAHHWQHWLDRGDFPDHPWRADLQRSALTLKGLTYAPTGAIAAAATTSLPETPGGERNWDYRYSWIRDSTFALWALYTLGFEWEANDFFYFVADMANAEQGALQIMYGIDGRAELPERTLDHLSGYENARPVRVGNAAHSQRQHDVWGAVLDSVYLHTKSRDALPDSVWPMLIQQVEAAASNWREPDRGIWEVRGEPKHFTSSKLMCWVALDRGARLAELREDWDRAASWRAGADEIHADICENALDDRGVFTQHYDTDALDASVLLMPLVRFLPADDERIRATVLAIADELSEDGLVLRYRVEDTDDGLSGEEGSFTICSFWLVSALCEIGEIERARAMCAKLLGHSSHARPLRRGDRPALRPPPRQLPAGVHAPRADQRGHARDPGRGGIRGVALGVHARPRAGGAAGSAHRDRVTLSRRGLTAAIDNRPARRKGAAGGRGHRLEHARPRRLASDERTPARGAKGPIIVAEGDGAWITDVDGNRYLDGLRGQWCVNVGYGRARLADAAAEQLKRLAFHPLTRGHVPAIELGERLEALLGGDRATFYSNSGLGGQRARVQARAPVPPAARAARAASRSSRATAPTTAPRSARCRPPARRCGAPATSRSPPASCTSRRRTRTATGSPTTTSSLTAALRRRARAHDRVRAARDRRRGDHGADHHRRRHPDPARLLPAGGEGGVRAPRRAADRRRGDLRLRAHRRVVRPRRLRRAARPRHDGQGHHERLLPARRDRRRATRSSPRSPPTLRTPAGCATSTRSPAIPPAARSRWRRWR